MKNNRYRPTADHDKSMSSTYSCFTYFVWAELWRSSKCREVKLVFVLRTCRISFRQLLLRIKLIFGLVGRSLYCLMICSWSLFWFLGKLIEGSTNQDCFGLAKEFYIIVAGNNIALSFIPIGSFTRLLRYPSNICWIFFTISMGCFASITCFMQRLKEYVFFMTE